LGVMQPPLSLRPLTTAEHQQLETGRRSPHAFTLRWCQLHLASARRQRPAPLTPQLRCATQSVRPALHAFHTRGLAARSAPSRRPKRTRAVLDAGTGEPGRALLHERPWAHPAAPGHGAERRTSVGNGGVTPYLVSIETIRPALTRLGVHGRRAPRWITRPDPHDAVKQSPATAWIRLGCPASRQGPGRCRCDLVESSGPARPAPLARGYAPATDRAGRPDRGGGPPRLGLRGAAATPTRSCGAWSTANS
jgi:hypothetical protein